MDDGKNILKIVLNWSLLTKADKGKRKYMGPKRSIILAAVMDVKESYNNMSVLIDLTKINEVEYALSLDLKLMNIILGITSHSSKHPCPYGECYKDNNGYWIKGKDRTIKNITANQKRWIEKSGGDKGNRAILKDYMNTEHEPLINGSREEPVIKVIPPPPLHTILLGPVNLVINELIKRCPNVQKAISDLHIQRSKYHGRDFEGMNNKILYLILRIFQSYLFPLLCPILCET